MVTAEVAVAIPSVLLILVVALAAVDLGISQVRCVDAARTGARLLARGEDRAVAVEQVRATAPSDAVVHIATSGDLVTVRVSAPVPPALVPLRLQLSPAASATALVEVGG